jgi:succinyl-CoA synthetase alpha subunit
VLVSVPGRFAFAEAMDALDAGCDVMIFSDNMPVEQEITLKDIAAERGLLVMGPDCGTAIVGGWAWASRTPSPRARSGWSPPQARARSRC